MPAPMPPCRYTIPNYTRYGDTESRAIFSADRQYRYLLERIWNPDPDTPVLMFVMAHPSIATEVEDDQTIIICKNRAIDHAQTFGGLDFGGVCVTNLFAFVQPYPRGYVSVDNQCGSYNNEIIREYASRATTTTVCAWGNGGDGSKDRRFLPQAETIKNILRQEEEREGVNPLNYFRLNPATQQPRHPSRFRSNIDFRVWER